jgi:hypothetical protein
MYEFLSNTIPSTDGGYSHDIVYVVLRVSCEICPIFVQTVYNRVETDVSHFGYIGWWTVRDIRRHSWDPLKSQKPMSQTWVVCGPRGIPWMNHCDYRDDKIMVRETVHVFEKHRPASEYIGERPYGRDMPVIWP